MIEIVQFDENWRNYVEICDLRIFSGVPTFLLFILGNRVECFNVSGDLNRLQFRNRDNQMFSSDFRMECEKS